MSQNVPANTQSALTLPSPVWRTWPWWPLQMIMQGIAPCYFRYRARGWESLPPDSGALLLINHRSYMDPLFAGLPLSRPVCFVARHDLFEVPCLGGLLRRTYVIPINRSATGTTSLRDMVHRLEHGFLVGLFPEGTRQKGNQPVGRLKPGFSSILRRVQVPVVAVGIAGATAVMPRGAKFIHPATIRVVFGNPVPASDLADLSKRGHEAELLQFASGLMTESVNAAREWLAETCDTSASAPLV